jgi:hypothetical protein
MLWKNYRASDKASRPYKKNIRALKETSQVIETFDIFAKY